MTVSADFTPDVTDFKGAREDILRSVRVASRRTGADFSYLAAQAAAESGFDSKARAATSSAAGLFQFLEGTWLDMVRKHGAEYGLGGYADAIENGTLTDEARQQVLAYRDDPRLSAAMAGEYARANRERLEESLGRRVGPTELYLAHFLGPGGAERFLKALDSGGTQHADELLPAAADANQAVFYTESRPRTVREVYDRFAVKFEGTAETGGTVIDRRRPDPEPTAGRRPGSLSGTIGNAASRPAGRPVPNFSHTRLSETALLFLASIDLERGRSVL